MQTNTLYNLIAGVALRIVLKKDEKKVIFADQKSFKTQNVLDCDHMCMLLFIDANK